MRIRGGWELEGRCAPPTPELFPGHDPACQTSLPKWVRLGWEFGLARLGLVSAPDDELPRCLTVVGRRVRFARALRRASSGSLRLAVPLCPMGAPRIAES